MRQYAAYMMVGHHTLVAIIEERSPITRKDTYQVVKVIKADHFQSPEQVMMDPDVEFLGDKVFYSLKEAMTVFNRWAIHEMMIEEEALV